MIVARSLSRRIRVFASALLFGAGAFSVAAHAATQVEATVQFEPAARGPRPEVEVWLNREEGGVFRQGEPMRVFFRTSEDAFVLIYNIDTEGAIHLVYPYGPDDPDRVEGGRTHQVPSRNDPYDLVADGPTGIEYIVAIASPFPFRGLPWYLTGGYGGGAPRADYDDDDYEESGVIVGDPYLGMDRIVRRVVPRGREDEVATADTYFYMERRVEYPRYVCADCHSYGGWYDPYVDVCTVVDIRIDATWARFRPLRSRVIRPRYFYMVRSSAPSRYRQWKERWSSTDGRATLRTRFHVDGQDKFRSRRDRIERRTPQEFRDLRRPRSGRTWTTRDPVIRRNDERRRDAEVRERSGSGRDDARERDSRRRWEERRERRQETPRDRGADRREDRERVIRERAAREREERSNRGRDAERRKSEERRREDAEKREERRRDDGDRGKSEERRRDDGDRGRSEDRRRDDGDRWNRGRGERGR